jgi:hypothetical protein
MLFMKYHAKVVASIDSSRKRSSCIHEDIRGQAAHGQILIQIEKKYNLQGYIRPQGQDKESIGIAMGPCQEKFLQVRSIKEKQRRPTHR